MTSSSTGCSSDEVTDPPSGHDVRTGDILPDWAVDRSSNLTTRGNVYVVWMDTRFNDTDHDDILLARSRNGGLSWDAPVVVDQAPRGVDAFTPMVDVDNSGRVAVSYYDFRKDKPGDTVLSTDLGVTHSHNGGATFPDESRVTTARSTCARRRTRSVTSSATTPASTTSGPRSTRRGWAPTTATSPTARTSSTGRPADGSGRPPRPTRPRRSRCGYQFGYQFERN